MMLSSGNSLLISTAAGESASQPGKYGSSVSWKLVLWLSSLMKLFTLQLLARTLNRLPVYMTLSCLTSLAADVTVFTSALADIPAAIDLLLGI